MFLSFYVKQNIFYVEPPAAWHLSLARGAFNGKLSSCFYQVVFNKTFLCGAPSGIEFFPCSWCIQRRFKVYIFVRSCLQRHKILLVCGAFNGKVHIVYVLIIPTRA